VLALVALAAIAGLIIAVMSLGSSGGKSTSSATHAAAGTAVAKKHVQAKHHAAATAPAARTTPAAETTVAVLNDTETTGLAHRVSSELQQRGYSQAAALSGRPAGSGQTTVVEYTAGHKADAEGVARSLSVSNVQPLETSAGSLTGSASVVVVVGADKAASGP